MAWMHRKSVVQLELQLLLSVLERGFRVHIAEEHVLNQLVADGLAPRAVRTPGAFLGGADAADCVVNTARHGDNHYEYSLPYLRAGGKILVNAQQINPMPVVTGAAEYPQAIIDKMGAQAEVKAINALALAKIAGNAKAVNVVLIGLLAKSTDIPYEKWVEAIKSTVPEKLLSVNLSAFDMGYNQL